MSTHLHCLFVCSILIVLTFYSRCGPSSSQYVVQTRVRSRPPIPGDNLSSESIYYSIIVLLFTLFFNILLYFRVEDRCYRSSMEVTSRLCNTCSPTSSSISLLFVCFPSSPRQLFPSLLMALFSFFLFILSFFFFFHSRHNTNAKVL